MADQLTDENQPEPRPAAVPVIALTPVDDKPAPVRSNIVAAVAPPPKSESPTYPLTPIRTTAVPAPGRTAPSGYRSAPVRRPPQAIRQSYRLEGIICLLVAVGWVFAAHRIYNWVGTLILCDSLSKGMSLMQSSNVPQAATGVGPGGLAPARGVQQSFSIFPPINPRRTVNTDLEPSVRPQPVGIQGDDPNARRADAMRRAIGFAEGTRAVWTLLMFALAGVIAVAGISAAFRTTATRLPPFAIVCIGLGVCVGALIGLQGAQIAAISPATAQPAVAQLLLSLRVAAAWVLGTLQDKYAWVAFLAIGCFVAVICGFAALRPTSNPKRWLIAAITVIFVGTGASLAGISVLERQADFPPLAVGAIGGVAAGQSFFAWVLLSMLHLRHPAAAK